MRETDPMEASASPRNPSVEMWNKSSEFASLEVACLETASSNSPAGMPPPSSATSMRVAACLCH